MHTRLLDDLALEPAARAVGDAASIRLVRKVEPGEPAGSVTIEAQSRRLPAWDACAGSGNRCLRGQMGSVALAAPTAEVQHRLVQHDLAGEPERRGKATAGDDLVSANWSQFGHGS
jgi:hypothetical protein